MHVAVVGEAMLERRASVGGGLATADKDTSVEQGTAVPALSYGGDTLNTSIHLARCGVKVSYITAVGSDAESQAITDAWRSEGVDISHVLAHPQRRIGSYSIHNDANGERHFTYDRAQSAAREVFSLAGIEQALETALSADLLYFSLISLAVLPSRARARLLAVAAERRRRGLCVAFDGNYRPILWPSHADALSAATAAVALSDIGLPTVDDEQKLRGLPCTAEDVAVAWRGAGCNEVVVKSGPDGCLIDSAEGRQIVPTAAVEQVKDSSGAGDAFNAGYLWARCAGRPADEAARAGHQIARWVIQRAGAIPACDADAPYSLLRAQSPASGVSSTS